MKRISATSFVVILGWLVATAVPAQAITIESPRKSHEFTKQEPDATVTENKTGEVIDCRFLTVHGAPSGTTNYTTVTPSFEECTMPHQNREVSYTNTTVCTVGQTVPWTWTLTSGANPFHGATTVNCVGKFTIGEVKSPACVLEIERQTTAAESLAWKTEASETSVITPGLREVKYASTGTFCGFMKFAAKGTLSIGMGEHAENTLRIEDLIAR